MRSKPSRERPDWNRTSGRIGDSPRRLPSSTWMAGRRGSVKRATVRSSPNSASPFTGLSSNSLEPERSTLVSPTGAKWSESLGVSSGSEKGTACSSCGCSDAVLACFGSGGRRFRRRARLSAAAIRSRVACSPSGRPERSPLRRSVARRWSSVRRFAASSQASPPVRENGIGPVRSTVRFRAESTLRSAVVTSRG